MPVNKETNKPINTPETAPTFPKTKQFGMDYWHGREIGLGLVWFGFMVYQPL